MSNAWFHGIGHRWFLKTGNLRIERLGTKLGAMFFTKYAGVQKLHKGTTDKRGVIVYRTPFFFLFWRAPANVGICDKNEKKPAAGDRKLRSKIVCGEINLFDSRKQHLKSNLYKEVL